MGIEIILYPHDTKHTFQAVGLGGVSALTSHLMKTHGSKRNEKTDQQNIPLFNNQFVSSWILEILDFDWALRLESKRKGAYNAR